MDQLMMALGLFFLVTLTVGFYLIICDQEKKEDEKENKNE